MFPLIVVLAIAGFLIYAYSVKGPACTACGSQICQGGCQMGTCCAITNDPQTWPSGDRIWLVCHAIAFAEGAHRAGSNPDRLNNPGDISDGFSEFGGEQHSNSNVTHFPDKATGWQWLYDKISNIANGSSASYSPSQSWNAFAQKWAGDWKNWVTNVTANLQVSPTSSLSDYLNS
jgi:hypothetical protein